MFNSETEFTKFTLFEIEVSKKGNSWFFIKVIGCFKELSNSEILFDSASHSSDWLISMVNISLSFNVRVSFSSLNIKLYLFKAGEFFSVKTLFHLPFLSSGLFSNNFACSWSRSFANAKILSLTIPISFLILQFSIVWNDTDLTGQ